MKKLLLVICAMIFSVNVFAQIGFWNKVFKANSFHGTMTTLLQTSSDFYIKTIDRDLSDGTSYEQIVGADDNLIFVVKNKAIDNNNLKEIFIMVSKNSLEALNEELVQLGYKKLSDQREHRVLYETPISYRAIKYYCNNIVVEISIFDDAPAGMYQINFNWR